MGQTAHDPMDVLRFIEAGMSMGSGERRERWPEWAALEEQAAQRFLTGERGAMVHTVADAIHHWARLPLIREVITQ